MEKYEIGLAAKAYAAGYAQGCEDFARDFIGAHGQTFKAAMTTAAGKMDGNMKLACEGYFDSLHKKKTIH